VVRARLQSVDPASQEPPRGRDSPEAKTRATPTLLTGKDAGRSVAICEKRLTIGCAAEAEIVIEDPGSVNETYVGSQPIGVALLRDGDQLRLGVNRVGRLHR
jgi:hypothetical protein